AELEIFGDIPSGVWHSTANANFHRKSGCPFTIPLPFGQPTAGGRHFVNLPGLACSGPCVRASAMNRFYLYVAMAFVTTFVGVSWAARGFPVGLSGPENSSRPEIVQPLPALVKSTFGDEHAKQYERKMWEAQHTA